MAEIQSTGLYTEDQRVDLGLVLDGGILTHQIHNNVKHICYIMPLTSLTSVIH